MTGPLVKAIETSAFGCRFRSRLEARWATFFEHLGINWTYEPQGFVLPSGKYLPDFRLEGGGDDDLWVEIKGALPDQRALNVAAEVNTYVGPLVIFSGGIPRRIDDAFFNNGHLRAEPALQRGVAWIYDRSITTWTPCDPSEVLDGWTGKVHYRSRAGAQAYTDALTAASSARFEFGQNPKRGQQA